MEKKTFFLRSSVGGVAYVTVFNSSDTWAATFRLREYKCKTRNGKSIQTDSGTCMRLSCQKTWEGTVENGQQAK